MSLLFDEEGVGVFACRPLSLSMPDRPPQLATLSVYRLPWRRQFCFWLDVKPGPTLLFERLQQGFEQTGGAPIYLLVRAVRPFGRRQPGDPTWLRTFDRLCKHYHCTPQECARPFSPGTDWMRQVDDCVHGGDWQSIAECHERLVDLARELSSTLEPGPVEGLLQPLPPKPFLCYLETGHRVGSDGFIRYAGDYYSAPIWYAGRTLWVRSTERHVLFYTADEHLVSQHKPGSGHGSIRLCLSHFSTTNTELCSVSRAWRAAFPDEELFLSLLLAQRRLGAVHTLRAILALTRRFRRTQLRHVFTQCRLFNNYSHRFIRGLLDADDHKLSLEKTSSPDGIQQSLF